MKKIFLVFILLFVFIFKVSAHTKFIIGEKVPNMYIEEYDDYNWHNGAPFVIKSVDGKIVYCIDPFSIVNQNIYYNEYQYNDILFNLTDEQIDRINTISYYGYNYDNHTDLKWYGITQFLIWKELNFKDVFFTNEYYGSRVTMYEEEILELENLVNNYYLLPSIANGYYEYDSNKNYTLIDTNDVLSNYEITSSEIISSIDDNKLYILTSTDGIYKIDFVRKNSISNDYILYGFSGSQSLIYPGKPNEIKFSITVEVNSGEVIINKHDSESKTRTYSKLEGAKYGLYIDDKLLNIIETDTNGIGYIDNLPLGQYYIKEITASLGYNLDTNIYYVNITKENKKVIINSYEDIIKGNLIINKYYGSDTIYKKEDNAVFYIYDNYNNLVDKYETKNGIIDEQIEYGDYYIVQTKGIDGYKFVDKFNLSIRDNSKYIFDLYNKREEIIVEVPDTFMIDKKIIISMFLIIFGISIILLNIILKKTTN